MGSLSDYAELALLEEITGKTAYAIPTVAIALCTAAPTDASTGSTIVEPSGSAYARKATSGLWGTAASGAIANSSAITFTTATGSWGTITHFALCDATTAGNMLAWGALTTSKAVVSGDTVSFAIGDLDITLD